MSMTREEAIEYFESLLKRFEEMYETETSYWGKVHTETTIEATRLALSALRPVSREQVKRKADARALVPCPGCGGENIVDCYRHNEVWYQCDDCGWQGPSVYSEGFADTEKARLAWNTRAPILSESEMEMLDDKD